MWLNDYDTKFERVLHAITQSSADIKTEILKIENKISLVEAKESFTHNLLIGIVVTVVGSLIVWFLTTAMTPAHQSDNNVPQTKTEGQKVTGKAGHL